MGPMFKDDKFDNVVGSPYNGDDVEWIRASKIAFKADEEGDVQMIRKIDDNGQVVDQT